MLSASKLGRHFSWACTGLLIGANPVGQHGLPVASHFSTLLIRNETTARSEAASALSCREQHLLHLQSSKNAFPNHFIVEMIKKLALLSMRQGKGVNGDRSDCTTLSPLYIRKTLQDSSKRLPLGSCLTAWRPPSVTHDSVFCVNLEQSF